MQTNNNSMQRNKAHFLARIGVIFFSVLLGLTFIVLNLPDLLRNIIESNIENESISDLLTGFVDTANTAYTIQVENNAIFRLETLTEYILFGILIYLCFLLVFSLRHFKLGFIPIGIFSLLGGIWIFQIIAWLSLLLAYILFYLWQFAMILRGIWDAIWAFCVSIIVFIQEFLLNYSLYVCLGLIFFVLIFVFRQTIRRFFLAFFFALAVVGACWGMYSFLPSVLLFIMKGVLFVYGLLLAVIRFIGDIFNFIGQLLAPIVGFIAYVIGLLFNFVLLSIGVLLFFGLPGYFILDQIRSAWHIGKGAWGIFLGSFGVGSSIALLLLVCTSNPQYVDSINLGWTNTVDTITEYFAPRNPFQPRQTVDELKISVLFSETYPPNVQAFIEENLSESGAPVFDAILLLGIMVISYLGFLRMFLVSSAKMSENPEIYFLPKELVLLTFGLLIQVLFAFLQAQEGNDN